MKRRVTPWYLPLVGVQSDGSIDLHSGTESASWRHNRNRSRRTSNSGSTGSLVSILAVSHGERPALSILRPRHSFVRSFRKTEGGILVTWRLHVRPVSKHSFVHGNSTMEPQWQARQPYEPNTSCSNPFVAGSSGDTIAVYTISAPRHFADNTTGRVRPSNWHCLRRFRPTGSKHQPQHL